MIVEVSDSEFLKLKNKGENTKGWVRDREEDVILIQGCIVVKKP